MYKDKIEGRELKKIMKNLPEKYYDKTLEITVKEYSDQDIAENIKRIVNKIRKRAINRSYLGKNSEIFFFNSEDINYEERKTLEDILKSYGYKVNIKEGQRNTLVVDISWKNEKI